MRKATLPLAILSAALFLSACRPQTRTLEISIPLADNNPAPRQQAVKIHAEPLNYLDVLSAIETIAAANGLKPWTDPLDDDLLSLTGMESPASSAALSLCHPQYPIYLSVTRQKQEILLLLNWPADSAADPKAAKLFNTLHQQLTTELSAKFGAAQL